MNKRSLLTTIILLLAVITIPKFQVQAANVKLDSTIKTVTVGKTATIKLKNNKKSVKWSVSNGKVQIIKNAKTYAKIRGITKGTATVKAKVGKKTYKCKVTVKPVISISKTALSLTEGKSESINLINATASKVNWFSNKTSVATVKKGVVTAKSVGSAIVTAKYDGKSYKCKVTVTAAPVVFDNTKAEKLIAREEMVVNGYVISKLISDYDFPTTIEAKAVFYDSSGFPVDYSSDSVDYLEKGYTSFLKFEIPSSAYSTYNVDYKFEPGTGWLRNTSIVGKMEMTSNETEDYIMVHVSNNSEYNCDVCNVSLIFYDENGSIVDITVNTIYGVDAGKGDIDKVLKPYSIKTFDDIPYSRYEAFVSCAYHWNF